MELIREANHRLDSAISLSVDFSACDSQTCDDSCYDCGARDCSDHCSSDNW